MVDKPDHPSPTSPVREAEAVALFHGVMPDHFGTTDWEDCNDEAQPAWLSLTTPPQHKTSPRTL